MLERKSGTIVWVSSMGGRIPIANESAYNAAKYAMCGFAEAMYLDLGGSGVDVKLVMPGPIDTEIWDIPGNEPALMDIEKVPAADCAAGIADALADDGFEYYVPPVYPGGIGAKDLAVAKVQDCDNYLAGMADMAQAMRDEHVARSVAVYGIGEPLGEAEAGEVAARGQAGAARVAAVEPGEHVAAPAGDRAVDGCRPRASSRSTVDRAVADVHDPRAVVVGGLDRGSSASDGHAAAVGAVRAARRTRRRGRGSRTRPATPTASSPSPRSTWCTSTSRQRDHTQPRCVRCAGERTADAIPRVVGQLRATLPSARRTTGAGRRAAPRRSTPRPGRDPGRALLGAARVLRPDLAPRGRLARCPRPPSALRARCVSTSARVQPGSRDCAAACSSVRSSTVAQHPPGPLADGFDVGDGRVPRRTVHHRNRRQALMPPSTVTVVPVAKPDASLAR